MLERRRLSLFEASFATDLDRRDACPTAIPNQRRGFDKVAAVADQVPVAREPAQPLHRREINQLVLQNFVGRMRIVNHLPFGVVPDNRRAAQPFQNADLDFLRAERDEPVEAGGKTFQRFAGQADNQIGVDVNAGFAAQKMEIVLQPFVILPAADEPRRLPR